MSTCARLFLFLCAIVALFKDGDFLLLYLLLNSFLGLFGSLFPFCLSLEYDFFYPFLDHFLGYINFLFVSSPDQHNEQIYLIWPLISEVKANLSEVFVEPFSHCRLN